MRHHFGRIGFNYNQWAQSGTEEVTEMSKMGQLLIAAQEGDPKAREQVARLSGNNPYRCTCIPCQPTDDQCPIHGFEAWQREMQQRAEAG